MKNQELILKLNSLLATLSVHYQNLRNFHWNIKGPQFFDLHVKFEEWYDQTKLQIDEVAERIITIDGSPLHKMSDYVKHSLISEAETSSDALQSMKAIQLAISKLLEIEKEILSISDQADDEGTNSLASDYIRDHEKLAWMVNAYLK